MKIITQQEIDGFMSQLQKDYFDNPKRKLLEEQNNREYWLFTEIWARCKNFFDGLREDREDARN